MAGVRVVELGSGYWGFQRQHGRSCMAVAKFEFDTSVCASNWQRASNRTDLACTGWSKLQSTVQEPDKRRQLERPSGQRHNSWKPGILFRHFGSSTTVLSGGGVLTDALAWR